MAVREIILQDRHTTEHHTTADHSTEQHSTAI